MSVSGLCQICEGAQATESCASCGALVCREHFDAAHGVCVDCAHSGRR